MQVIALADAGSLFDPGPCMYMEKIALGPRVDPSLVSLEYTTERNLQAVALALGKPIQYASTAVFLFSKLNNLFFWIL